MDQLPNGLWVPSITEQRESIGLTTPTQEEREFIWSQITIPSAGISRETGGYRPHRIQSRVANGPWRIVAIGGGLRGGKSLGSSVEGTVWLPHSNLIWLAGETYDIPRQEFEYMAEAATSLNYIESITMTKNRSMPCAFETDWGCRVETRSLHDLGAVGQGSSLTARAPDLIIICEPGFAPPEALAQSQERLTTRRGRLWMAGTFERSNAWFVEAWKKWVRWPNADMAKAMAIPSWLNTASFPGGRQDPEIERIRKTYATLREFLVRWGGIPLSSDALMMGAYWDVKKHVTASAKFQPVDTQGKKLPVEITIDPGFSGKSSYAVLAIQRFGEDFNIIDEVSTQTMVHEEVINLCRTRPWWPHVTGGVIDPYAGVSHVFGGLSPIEVWWKHGKIPVRAAPRYEVEDAVARLQYMLRDPGNARTHIHAVPEATRLQFEMEHWRRKQDREGLGKPSEMNCDAIKALAYYCCAKYADGGPSGHARDDFEITVHDYSLGGHRKGYSRADRYPERSNDEPI